MLPKQTFIAIHAKEWQKHRERPSKMAIHVSNRTLTCTLLNGKEERFHFYSKYISKRIITLSHYTILKTTLRNERNTGQTYSDVMRWD